MKFVGGDNVVKEYFLGKRKEFSFEYIIDATEFQKKVYEELLKIPYGETRTYKDIAILIGNEKSSRAVGSANNKNKLLFVIPCHRVIGGNSKLVGYRLGLDIKKDLLEMEKSYGKIN